MPRLHEKIIAALPAERLRVGEFEVDPSTREIARAGVQPVRVSLKAIDVLLMLVAHEGKVVGRHALLEAIWPDTLPTDEVVTQAIAQLRRAFGDGKPAEYIETIAKHGYRLKAPVLWLPRVPRLPDAAANDEPPPAGPRSRVALGVAFAAGALALAAGVLFWRAQQRDANPVRAPAPAAAAPQAFERLTSRPGVEAWAAPSPDGSVIAYSEVGPERSGGRLMVQSTASSQPIALTEASGDRTDTMPAWSPDGREIAFLRFGDGACRYMLVPATGGEPRQLASCSGSVGHFSWRPDGRALALSHRTSSDTGGALHLLDIATGTLRPVRYDRGAGDDDMYPMFSPDGRWIVFQRNVSRGDLWRIPAAGGRAERLTRLETNFYGFSWLPGGNALVLSRHEGDGLRLSRLDVATRRIVDLGIENVAFPQTALRAPVVAFTVSSFVAGLYRARPDAAEAVAPVAPPARAFASTATEMLPSVSPDGRQLLFASDRSGSTRLWWVDLDRPATLRPIAGFDPVVRHPPAWSADGRRVLAVGDDGDGERLAEIALPEGRVRWLPPLAEGRPVQAIHVPGEPDAVVAVVDTGAGKLAAIRYDTRSTPWRAQRRLDDVAVVRADPAQGRLVLARTAQWGLWETDLQLDRLRLLDDLHRRRGERSQRLIPEAGFFHQSRRLLVGPDGTAILGGDEECPLRWFALPIRDGASAPCLDPRRGTVLGASYDAAGGVLYYAYETDHNDDIGWLSLDAGASRR